MIAYGNSVNDVVGAKQNTDYKNQLSTAGSSAGKNSLDAKACMISLPQEETGVSFAMGAIVGKPTIFPDKYYIFDIDNHKIALKKMEIKNVDGFCGISGCTVYTGGNPDVCTVTVSFE